VTENGHGHILVVEDDREIRDLLLDILRQAGYRVLGAANGLEALRLLGGGTLPCLILLDLRMPVMTGWEFLTARKQDPRLAGVAVAVLSAEGLSSARAQELAADHYLGKPVDVGALLRLIARHCGPPAGTP
jgi:CheY-like chemotaxis protein